MPYTNKKLDIEFETFRDKLIPGQQEEWKIKIKDKKGDKLAAEMMATLYDASLDIFKPNNWYFNIYNNYYSNLNWDVSSAFGNVNAQLFTVDWNNYPEGAYRNYDRLNWFGYSNGMYGYYTDREDNSGGISIRGARSMAPMAAALSGVVADEVVDAESETTTASEEKSLAKKKFRTISCPSFESDASATTTSKYSENGNDNSLEQQYKQDLSTVKARNNFSETAFFYPALETDNDGNVIIKFTIPVVCKITTLWKGQCL